MRAMIIKILTVVCFGIFLFVMNGCLYRGDGIFKRMGDSDYKARFNFMNLFAVADGRPIYVRGVVLQEDHVTPVKNIHIILKDKEKQSIVSNSQTDHIGSFNISGLLSHDTYIIEIDSPDYLGSKEIIVEPDKRNWHEIIAYKR